MLDENLKLHQLADNYCYVMEKILNSNQPKESKIGYAAEIMVSESFTRNAVRKQINFIALNDRSSQGLLPINDPMTDIVIIDISNKEIKLKIQSKYCKTVKNTKNAVLTINDRHFKYEKTDALLIPYDQLSDVKKYIKKKLLKEKYRIETGDNSRQQVFTELSHIYDKLDSQISYSGVSSDPFTYQQMQNFVEIPDLAITTIKADIRALSFSKILHGYAEELVMFPSRTPYGYVSLLSGFITDCVENTLPTGPSSFASIPVNIALQTTMQKTFLKNCTDPEKRLHFLINVVDATGNFLAKTKEQKAINRCIWEITHGIVTLANNKKTVHSIYA